MNNKGLLSIFFQHSFRNISSEDDADTADDYADSRLPLNMTHPTTHTRELSTNHFHLLILSEMHLIIGYKELIIITDSIPLLESSHLLIGDY